MSSTAQFETNLQQGRLTETAIVKWLRARGNGVVTVYEIEHHTGKGPRYFAPTKAYVAPDILVFPKDEQVLWCEAKHKTVFSWHRKTQRWVTGVDIRHYEDYQRVQDETGIDVWLIFAHHSATPSESDLKYGAPPFCPSGLFGQRLEYLTRKENHRSDNWGSSGMVYWAESSLLRLGDYPAIEA